MLKKSLLSWEETSCLWLWNLPYGWDVFFQSLTHSSKKILCFHPRLSRFQFNLLNDDFTQFHWRQCSWNRNVIWNFGFQCHTLNSKMQIFVLCPCGQMKCNMWSWLQESMSSGSCVFFSPDGCISGVSNISRRLN